MATDPPARPTAIVVQLGSAQTLAWASSFYLPAILASDMARDLGVGRPTVFAALSASLVVSAFAGPAAGRLIDRHGGRPVLMASNGLFALGLLVLAGAQGVAGLLAAWALLGLAMAAGLYDAAFAALVRLYRGQARASITGITLIAGFASTVGWPFSAWMDAAWGWRGACVGWAVLHVLVGLPLNARLPRPPPAMAPPPPPPDRPEAPVPARPAGSGAAWLALLFTLSGFVSTAVATHLPALLGAAGAGAAAALAAAALVGPAQVAARLLEFGFLRRRSPLVGARAALLGHPLGVAALLWLGTGGLWPFAVLHGLGNGLLTIVRGTLPLVLFGAEGYGARQGWITLPSRIVGAASPWLFGLVIEHWGLGSLGLTAALGLASYAVLLRLMPLAEVPSSR